MTTPAQGPDFYDPALGSFDLTRMPIPRVSDFSGSAGLRTPVNGPGMIIAMTWRNASNSAAADAKIHDGHDATGQLLMSLGAPAGGGIVFGPGLPGIPFTIGLFLENIGASTYDGTIVWVPLVRPPD